MKYYSKKTKYDGLTFDSIKERDRYIALSKMQDDGVIGHLQCQVRFEILPRLDKLVTIHMKTKDKTAVRCDEKAKYYTADFVYFDNESDKMIVEDVKSKVTAFVRDYPLRRHLMKMHIDRLNELQEMGRTWEFREYV